MTKFVKIAIVIPTRGDRPDFLNHCKRMIHNQTYSPDEVIFVDYEPTRRNIVDLTVRYKKGINIARQRGCNVIFFWEDDDWYDCRYLEWMMANWERSDKPEVFGISVSYYFNLLAMKGTMFDHPLRSSMFCTALHIHEQKWNSLEWPADDERFLDLWIWRRWNKLIRADFPFPTDKIYTVGIKHGTGMLGGGGHEVSSNIYINSKYNRDWLESVVDPQSFEFYKKYEVRNRHSDLSKS
jgi:hypothetical protein